MDSGTAPETFDSNPVSQPSESESKPDDEEKTDEEKHAPSLGSKLFSIKQPKAVDANTTAQPTQYHTPVDPHLVPHPTDHKLEKPIPPEGIDTKKHDFKLSSYKK
jgi:hypothetical protein